MACYGGASGGHHEDRFQTSVDKNFFCPICQEVLKDPVQCHNEHYFCKACITQHLKNSKTCPVCMEKVTEETLNKPTRIVTNYLDGLIINCDHNERGCTKFIELGRLEVHLSVCDYRPVSCPNEKCAKIMNFADLEKHTSEVCEYRQVYCEECDENMSVRKYCKHGCVISKDVQAMKASFIEMQDQVKEMSETQKEISKAQKELFKEIKNLSAAVNRMTTREVKEATPCDAKPQGNIVVVGGQNQDDSNWTDWLFLKTVEMYSLTNRTWSKLAPMQIRRASLTAHFYNGKVMVTGGHGGPCNGKEMTNSIEYIYYKKLKSSCAKFSSFVSQLPIKSSGHKTAILNNHLWMVGGCWSKKGGKAQCSNAIYTTPINSPHTWKVTCQMPRPLSYHGLEMVNSNEQLIIGGSTTGYCPGAVDAVLLYNMDTSSLKELCPLPFPLCDMATVKYGEDVIIIGGSNDIWEDLNTVFKYNWRKNKCEQLPGMKHKRSGCAAVISGNKVFVMGGYNEEQRYLSSVECFDFEHQVWYELPLMNEAKRKIAAVLVP